MPEKPDKHFVMMLRGETGMRSFDPHHKKKDSRLQSSGAKRTLDEVSSSPPLHMHQPLEGKVIPIESRPVMLGRYEIVEELGAGQMGTVYRGRDKVLERDVAIKVPKLENSEIQTLMIRRFYREARAVARLNHPSICPIYDVGEVDGKVFIAMGFIKGTTLDRVVGNGKSLRPRAAAKLIQRACMAMQHAHDNQVVHRDLKTSNMMIDSDGQPVLLDFGLAMLRDDKDTGISHDGQILGSPAYMSPEQVNGLCVDHRADIFSMGVVFYEVLTGHRPFKGTFTQVLMGIAQGLCEAPHLLNPEVPADLSELCQRMMATSPDVRFQTMREAAEGLAKYLTGTAAGAGEKASRSGSDARSPARRAMPGVKESLRPAQVEPADPPPRPQSHRASYSSKRKSQTVQLSDAPVPEESRGAIDPSVRSLWRRATEAVKPGTSQMPEKRQRRSPRRVLSQVRWWIASIMLVVTSWIAIALFIGKSSAPSTPLLNSADIAPTHTDVSSHGVSKASFSLDELDSSP